MSVKAKGIEALRSDKARQIGLKQRDYQEREAVRVNSHNTFRNALHAFENCQWTEENLTLLRYHIRMLLDELEDAHVFARADIRVWRTVEMLHAEFRVQPSWQCVHWVCVSCVTPILP